MSDFAHFNRETRAERTSRKERAELITIGPRGRDGLTHAERLLLMKLRAQGMDIRRSWLMNHQGIWGHGRVVVELIGG